ncbi:MAG: amino acid adenylation domain-containing protein [Ruminococcaceae bacterium]|nr:amino acid adenylation domain-containing protein [Oscillospiraceae bacterium]
MSYQKNALEYLENTASLYPDKTAFADDARAFSFSSLMQSAKSVSSELIGRGVSLRDRVAVMIDRTAISLVGFFASLYAGACYVPIDVKMPEDRMSDILSQISPSAILLSRKDEKLADYLLSFANVIFLEDAVGKDYDDSILESIRDRVLDIDPAYMIFTSGSTGKPKGIPISHRALIDFTEWMSDYCEVRSDDILGNQAPFYFDLSVKDIYQTLKNGCTTYILPKKLFMFPTLLADHLNSHNVTALIWSTSAFRLVADSGIFEKKSVPSLKKVILGGEALLAKHLNIWKAAHPKCQFINLYGPTEVTVDCTAYKIDRDFADGEPIPIGKACRNMEVILLDEELNPVPSGVSGEICVRGIGLALGYFGDSYKTSQSFIDNPLNPYYPEKLYRTGDIAKVGEDGNLYFLSRRDEQIKHMGYRIELGEIETVLSAVAGVGEAVCLFDQSDDQIVCCAATDLDPSEIIQAIKSSLPKYMIPNVWKITSSLPHNSNGKIDRAKLKADYFAEKSK